MVNWPTDILKVMSGIASSSPRLFAYRIFISCVVDHLEINTSDLEVIVTNSCEHLIDDNLIHKMGIYKYGDNWMYQEYHNTTVDLELFDGEGDANQIEQGFSESVKMTTTIQTTCQDSKEQPDRDSAKCIMFSNET
ncbi:hypothetical protein Lal_00014543 [Lupinus albus]|nr:hypothetical protein Lal_00014543 [Lupinus albus]